MLSASIWKYWILILCDQFLVSREYLQIFSSHIVRPFLFSADIWKHSIQLLWCEIFDSCYYFIKHFDKGDIHLVNRDRLLEVLEFYKVTCSSLFAIDVLVYMFQIICIYYLILQDLHYLYLTKVSTSSTVFLCRECPKKSS